MRDQRVLTMTHKLNLKPTDEDPEIVEIAAQLSPQLINALAHELCDKLNQNSQSSATI